MLLSDIVIDFMISVGVLREVRALALRKRAPACCSYVEGFSFSS
jgi:hypothetical protein